MVGAVWHTGISRFGAGYNAEWRGPVGHGPAGQGLVWYGKTRIVVYSTTNPERGEPGSTWRGKARLGMAWRGRARQGKGTPVDQ